MIRSYNKLYHLGNKAIDRIFETPVLVQEKVDGSQFSFMKVNNEIHCRSKGAVINVHAPEKMFTKAVEVVNEIKDLLNEGWIYRGEYLARPKHNTLFYDRTPKNHIALFDVDTGHNHFLDPESLKKEAERIGLESVPVFYQGMIDNYEMFRELLDKTQSFLGKVKIEGVVVKNYQLFASDGNVMMGKFVSEEFKEIHQKEWKKTSPNNSDIVQQLIEKYSSKARWNKVIQHLRDDGILQNAPQDISVLLKELSKDVLEDAEEDIKNALFKWAWPRIARSISRGFPEYYKEYLLKESFNNEDENDDE